MALIGIAPVASCRSAKGPYYRDLSENNRTRSVILEPARGLIYDRNGVLLANNVPSFSLYVLAGRRQRPRSADRTVERVDRHLDAELVRKKLSGKGAKQLPRKIKDRLTLRRRPHRSPPPRFARSDDPGGISTQLSGRRDGAHVLGYVGEMSAEQLEKPEFADLHQGSIVGQYGVEKFFDQDVRGRRARKALKSMRLVMRSER